MTKHARSLVQFTLLLVLAGATGACSTIASLDPTGLLGDDKTVPDNQFPTDSSQQAQADADTTTPDLASLPARPTAPSTAQQTATAQSVTTAGAQAQYSADALRAGTEPSAPPPVATDPAAAKQAMASADAPPTAEDAAPTASAPAASAPPPRAVAPAPAAAPSAAPAVQATPAQTAAMTAQPAAAANLPPTAAADVAPTAEEASGGSTMGSAQASVAAVPPSPASSSAAAVAPGATPSAAAVEPSRAEPAVPAVPAGPAGATMRLAMLNPSNAELGFKPSSAPALDPSIAQWVSPSILAHYRQTAALAGAGGTATAAVPAVPAAGSATRLGTQGGGDVVANLNAVPGTPAGMAAAMNGGIAPAEIIYFPGDSATLTAAARKLIREAAAAFKAAGGTGSVKVVGHSSSRTADMPVEKHLEVIFQKSQDRADAVAQALIHDGVPADKVIVQAVGDSQPIYYESMPKGEEGNRRAEIFLQS